MPDPKVYKSIEQMLRETKGKCPECDEKLSFSFHYISHEPGLEAEIMGVWGVHCFNRTGHLSDRDINFGEALLPIAFMPSPKLP